jgi:hypothetical protein
MSLTEQSVSLALDHLIDRIVGLTVHHEDVDALHTLQ